MKISMKPRMLQVRNTLMAFATPIHQTRYDGLADFNAEVAKRILTMRDATPTQHNSNVGGWQSEKDFLSKLGEPYAGQLARMFLENVNAAIASVAEMTDAPPSRMSIDAWANVNARGDTNAAHIHPGCPWSGVYYVAIEPDKAGEIYFLDPRTAALMSNHPLSPFTATNQVTVKPDAGLMLVFPSFVYHGVKPYLGDSPRINIAFNLR